MLERCRECNSELELSTFGKDEEYCSLECAMKDLQLKFYTTRKDEECQHCHKTIDKGTLVCRSGLNKALLFCGVDEALEYYEIV